MVDDLVERDDEFLCSFSSSSLGSIGRPPSAPITRFLRPQISERMRKCSSWSTSPNSVKNGIVAPRPFMQCSMNLLRCSGVTGPRSPHLKRPPHYRDLMLATVSEGSCRRIDGTIHVIRQEGRPCRMQLCRTLCLPLIWPIPSCGIGRGCTRTSRPTNPNCLKSRASCAAQPSPRQRCVAPHSPSHRKRPNSSRGMPGSISL